MGLRTAIFLLAAAVALNGCERSGSKISGPIHQRGYLWQREWTPAVIDALDTAQTHLDGVILLAAEIDWNGTQPEIVRPEIDWKKIKSLRKPCGIALRVAPFSGQIREADARIQSILDVTKDIRKSSVRALVAALMAPTH